MTADRTAELEAHHRDLAQDPAGHLLTITERVQAPEHLTSHQPPA